jgi:predicted 3-demethylubiquinone-9 3-methyltransferase (glyoxalase superfamily)
VEATTKNGKPATEETIKFYLSVFKNTKQGTLARRESGIGLAKAGSLMFADFMLANQ